MIELIVDKEFMTCTKCNKTYPATEEFFYKQKYTTKTKGTFYKLTYPCKKCRIKDTSQYQQENREKYLEYKSKHNKMYFSKPENKEKHREILRRSREKGYLKTWQQNNKDKIGMYNQKRKSNKQHAITKSEWEHCRGYFNNCCAYCGIPEHEAKEQQGNNLHKEHVIHDGANDLSNCVPSCKVCNSSKNIYELNEWYNEQNENYIPERLEKINNWLNNDYKLYIKPNK